MDGRLGELRTQRAAAQGAVAAARAKVKAAAQRVKDQAKKDRKTWVLTERQKHVALIAYAQAGCEVAPAMEFLAKAAAKHKWPKKTAEQLRDVVEGLFDGASVEELRELCDLENPKDLAAARQAVRLTEEWRLYRWVRGLNYGRGVAPPTETVLQRFEDQRLRLPEGVRPAYRGVAAMPSARMWAKRFRGRFAGKHGRIKCKSNMEPQEIRDKARSHRWVPIAVAGSISSPDPGPILSPDSGPILSPDSGPIFRKAGPKSSPDSGPKIETGFRPP